MKSVNALRRASSISTLITTEICEDQEEISVNALRRASSISTLPS